MKKTINFAYRNFKEIIRDPLSVIFAVLLPLFLLFIFQQFKIPSDNYKLENFTPAIVIFAFSFITLFTASLVAKDRVSSLLMRLCASPMKPYQYILGYILSIFPLIFLQNILFFTTAVFLGLRMSPNIAYAILSSLPLSILFISLGIFIGSISSERSASGVSSIAIQLVAFTSGMYFPAEMIGVFFSALCRILPFSHAINITKGILNGNIENPIEDILIYAAYTVVICILSIIIFRIKLNGDSK